MASFSCRFVICDYGVGERQFDNYDFYKEEEFWNKRSEEEKEVVMCVYYNKIQLTYIVQRQGTLEVIELSLAFFLPLAL